MSAQRRKKTRSAASRYRRYVRLTSTTGELRLQLIESAIRRKKKKDTLSEKSVQSVGVRVHTPPRLHSLRLRLGSGSACSACALVVTDDSKKLRRPHRLALRRHAAPTRNRRLQSLSTSLVKSGASRVKSAGLLPKIRQTPTECRKAFNPSVCGYSRSQPPSQRYREAPRVPGTVRH